MRTFPIFLLLITLCGCAGEAPSTVPAEDPGPFIVFVTGDEEYRSEESMPMLARMAEREFGARTQVLHAVDSAGFVNPNEIRNIEGLGALDSADMMVAFLRWRELPDDQLRHITDFAESGKPMVGFRTSTHTFNYPETDTAHQYLNNKWPTAVWGQQWITHHGHFADGHDPLTRVTVPEPAADHAILRGVTGFDAYSWLYHVDGGDWSINPKTDILLEGRSLRSKHEENGRLDEFPISNPVAWTNDYKGARVFFTTLGHPYDWQAESMRRLALNGMAWALEREVPEGGFDATVVGSYAPNNSGFGEKFKGGRRPGEF